MHIERRTSNAQHRTSNNDDAALYLFFRQTNHCKDVIYRQLPGTSAAESNIDPNNFEF